TQADNHQGLPAPATMVRHPATPDRRGCHPAETPARWSFTEGPDRLHAEKQPADQHSRRGETALILAVQAKSPAMVRLLIKSGANPDKADHIAGMSARDYAKRDDRTGTILPLLDAKAGAQRDLGTTFGPK
ncbi:MAG: hypothetical protein IBJ13_08205, partial [Sphingopyxis sp.]|nr:hypothetical protein [Sphingopyxis sp.]